MKKYAIPKLLHKEVMGDPFMPDMSEVTERIRRNLLAVGMLALAIHFLDVSPSSDSSFLGVKLENFNLEKLDFILFSICAYLVVHFATRCDEFIREVRIRLTGSDPSASRGAEDNYFHDSIVDWGDEHDYPSTLYRYWYGHVHLDYENPEKRLAKHLSDLERAVPEKMEELKANLERVISCYEELNRKISPVLNTDRIKLSLERFDSWFASLQKAYILRISIIEMGVPFIVGVAAMFVSFEGFLDVFLDFIWPL
ncbi:hypothetical protein M2318_004191 [Metapseudomonas resinovorans]|uniref:hypothetical protein n=1 Tax=Metapseudomonas resinovorans TaxID=53412 RepID=UPI003D1FC9E4